MQRLALQPVEGSGTLAVSGRQTGNLRSAADTWVEFPGSCLSRLFLRDTVFLGLSLSESSLGVPVTRFVLRSGLATQFWPAGRVPELFRVLGRIWDDSGGGGGVWCGG
jgi:hypothetical protein